MGEEPDSLDPVRKTSQAGQSVIVNLYENLMRPVTDNSGKAKVTGAAAGSYKSNNNYDGTVTYTFHLRNAKWSDGQKVKAEDFVYAWRRLADPATNSPYATLLQDVVGYKSVRSGGDLSKLKVTAKDASTLVVVLTGQCPWFLTDVCTAAATMPLRKDVVQELKEAAKKRSKESGGTTCGGWCSDPVKLVTNGPYCVGKYTEGKSLLLKVNCHYSGTFSGPENMKFIFADTAKKAWALYKAKKVDFISPLPETELKTLAKNKGWEPESELRTWSLLFNTTKKPFSDPLARRAFASAVDRTALSEAVSAAARPAGGLVPYGVPDTTSEKDFRKVGGELVECSQENYASECKKGRQLLKKAGYESGSFPSIKIVCTSETKNVAQMLAKMFSDALKAQVTVNCVDKQREKEALEKGEYTMAVSDIGALANDAESFLALWRSGSKSNVVGYRNSAYDTLLGVIGSASDERARIGCLHDAESLLLNDCPLTPLYFTGSAWKLRETLTGVCRDARGWFSFSKVAQVSES